MYLKFIVGVMVVINEIVGYIYKGILESVEINIRKKVRRLLDKIV